MKGVIDPYPGGNNVFGEAPDGAEHDRPVCSVCFGTHRTESFYVLGDDTITAHSCVPEPLRAEWATQAARLRLAARGSPAFTITSVIQQTVCLARVDGPWVTEREIRERQGPAGRVSSAERLRLRHAGGEFYTPNNSDLAAALAVLDWLAALNERGADALTDYEAALVVLWKTRHVFPQQWGIACSAHQAMLRDKKKLDEQAAEAERVAASTSGEWHGSVGERVVLGPLECVDVKALGKGDYGERFLIRFTLGAKTVIWFTGESGKFEPEPGGVYYCKATIKDHTVFDNQRQTVITRPDETDEKGNAKNPRTRKKKVDES